MAYRIIRPADREAWLQEREKGIGSSEATTLMGVNHYEDRYRLFMRKTGQMEALTRPVVRRLRAPWQMSLLTVVNCIFMNTILPDQYLAISMPGQMYGDEYDKRGLSREELGSTVLGGGAVTSPLVPWNTCGIYCMTILGVSPLRYGRYALFGLILPVVTVLRSFIRKKK